MLLAYNGLQFTLISQTVGIETQYSKIVLKTYQKATRQTLNTVTICSYHLTSHKLGWPQTSSSATCSMFVFSVWPGLLMPITVGGGYLMLASKTSGMLNAI